MALKKNDVAAAAAASAGAGKPRFEDDDNGTTTAQRPADPVVAEQVASTAIAKAAASSVAVARDRPQAAFQDLKNALPPMDFGVLPRLVGANGIVMDADKNKLGVFIDLDLVSYNDEFVVSPGDDSAEAKKHVRYSADGKTINETGEDVAEYLKHLREVEEYPKANVKQYLQLVGILTASEKESEHKDGMVQVSLSPQSRKLFEGFQIQQGVKVLMGTAPAVEEGKSPKIRLTADSRTLGDNTFTVLKPSQL